MPLRIAYFGTYDPAYARNRILVEGLRANGAQVEEFNAPYSPALSAARLATPAGAGEVACDLARAHLALLRQHRSGLCFDVVIVGYPGHLIVPFARLMAWYRRALLVFDPLVSLADTFAGDRALVRRDGAAARAVRLVDRLSFGLPGLVLADTQADADYFARELRVPGRKLAVVPVGALPVADATGSARDLAPDEPLTVLQYGKWSPLHGTDLVLDAAAGLRDEPFRFVMVGGGQLSAALRDGVAQRRLANVELVEPLPPAELERRMLAADVCLGVFGASGKAARVIPNKVYDGLACGRPVVTQDSAAARELLSDGQDALLTAAGQAGALAAALRRLRDRGERARLGAAGLDLYRARCTPEIVGAQLLAALEARR